jgi:hypothetical protein
MGFGCPRESNEPSESNGTFAFNSSREGGNPPVAVGSKGWELISWFREYGRKFASGTVEGRNPRAVIGDAGQRRNEAGSSLEAKSEYRACRITACNVRGLQIGMHTLQINSYEYEVERPNIDFATVLSRADVREALTALKGDPDNADLQRKADRLLGSGPMFRKEAELRVEQSKMSSDRQSSVFDAFIFVEHCTGVQIGDDTTQKNRFLYVVAPALDAAQLLADDPSVRSAIIDCVCSTNEACNEDVLKDELAAALESAVLSSPDIRTAGNSIPLPAHGRVDIANKDGRAGGKPRTTAEQGSCCGCYTRNSREVSGGGTHHR